MLSLVGFSLLLLGSYLVWGVVANVPGFLMAFVVIGLIGYVTEAMVPGEQLEGGWLPSVALALIGSWIGVSLLGKFGPTPAGVALLPSLLGAGMLSAPTVALMRMSMGKKIEPRNEEARDHSRSYTLHSRKRAG